jgi:hypothetical protein
MRYTPFFVFAVIFAMSLGVYTQTRTVTNADLEKFREQRIAAEQELRENYERLGFPSPEERERQRVESIRERESLAERLRLERLERERLDAEMRQRAAANASETVVIVGSGSYRNNRSIGGFYYSPRGFRGGRHFFYGRQPQITWRATPGGVIYEPGGRSSYVWSPRIEPRPRVIRPRR